MKKLLLLTLLLFSLFANSQIVIDNNAPYNTPQFLVDDILLGGGVVATNHVFMGHPSQIGWFNAINTPLGIDSGVVMGSGDIYALDPVLGSTFPAIPNTVADPDLLAVANSVPPLLPPPYTNSFTVSSINDVAVLEFDFIPTSDSLSFNYVFGSEEYFAFENSQYNDVFGFFLSGPGISGPYSSPSYHPNGSINLAIVPGSNPPLPITISSVNSVTPINSQFFVDNQGGLDTIAYADGYTTVLTANATVQCGETYHIRLAIADGSDSGLSSFVWLQAGSFSSPVLEVVDDLGLDSTVLEIPCNSNVTLTANGGVGATYEWYDQSGNIFSTNNVVTVGNGTYWVTATSFGCPVISDTLTVISQSAPVVELGNDITIDCNSTVLLDPNISGGSGVYNYLWNNNSTSNTLNTGGGFYSVIVTDDQTGCYGEDSINIIENQPPNTVISGGGSICSDGSTVQINFLYDGLIPWDLQYFNQTDTFLQTNIQTANYSITTSTSGTYQILNVLDYNDCMSNYSGQAIVQVNQMPEAVLSPDSYILYIGDTLLIQLPEDYSYYQWFDQNNDSISNSSVLSIYQAGDYYVYVEDQNGCFDYSNSVTVDEVPRTELYVPNTFTPNADWHNEVFTVYGKNIKEYSLKIFNRWGDLLFESNDIQKHWDGYFKGRKVDENKYLYYIEIIGEDDVLFTKSGIINLIY